MDPLAEKILEIKKKKETEERKRLEEIEKVQKRKKLILDNRADEFLKMVQYLIERANRINKDLNAEELKYTQGERLLKIDYGNLYITFNFDYIYKNEPEGTQIIVTVAKKTGIEEALSSKIEEYYWIPRVPESQITWTLCNNYHMEGEVKDVSIIQAANHSLEKFILKQLEQ
jgi:hypothetical protein